MVTYETHITVESDEATVAAAIAIARELGVEWTHIELSSGDRPSQPMLTCDQGATLEAHRAAVARITVACERERICVLRIKTECSLDAPECAADDERGRCATNGRYFETHVKVLLDRDSARDRARTVAAEHRAHFSRNARRAGAVEERFLTVRLREASRARAQNDRDALVRALEAAGLTVRSTRVEYVLFDSDWSVDRGWAIADERDGQSIPSEARSTT